MGDVTATRLPRGRHGLSRDQVVGSQRDRILLALAEAMAEKGFVSTTVADVLLRAGVSRETFYQQFSSKVDAFSAAFDAAAELLFAQAVAAFPAEGAGGAGPAAPTTPLDRFEAAFSAYLDTLADNPAFARVFLVEVYAAGPEAIARRAALQGRIVDVLADQLEVGTEQGRFACEVLVAAVGSLVTVPLVRGDLEALRALRTPVTALVRTALATARP